MSDNFMPAMVLLAWISIALAMGIHKLEKQQVAAEAATWHARQRHVAAQVELSQRLKASRKAAAFREEFLLGQLNYCLSN